MSVGEHYNHITNLWPYIMGHNFHWGYFTEKTASLEEATNNLIDEMISMIHIKKDSTILDVGCGIGEPAFYIFNKYGNRITGISNSPNGIEKANSRSKELGLNNMVDFFTRDALNNGFASETFDNIWLMEMSHLIENKVLLIEECKRVVKSKGKIVLCDLMLKRDLSAREIFLNMKELLLLEKSFGKAQLRTISFYLDLFNSLDMKKVEFKDISYEVQKTLDYWIENCKKNEKIIIDLGYEEDLSIFIESCNILKGFYSREIWGYGIIVGEKK